MRDATEDERRFQYQKAAGFSAEENEFETVERRSATIRLYSPDPFARQLSTFALRSSYRKQSLILHVERSDANACRSSGRLQ